MTETPADTIRRAATLMRARATKATPGPWRAPDITVTAGPDAYWGIYADEQQEIEVAAVHVPLHDTPSREEIQFHNADHIAAMHPGVAVAIADQWDAVGTEMAYWNGFEDEHGRILQCLIGPKTEWTTALAAARTYLGETT